MSVFRRSSSLERIQLAIFKRAPVLQGVLKQIDYGVLHNDLEDGRSSSISTFEGLPWRVVHVHTHTYIYIDRYVDTHKREIHRLVNLVPSS